MQRGMWFLGGTRRLSRSMIEDWVMGDRGMGDGALDGVCKKVRNCCIFKVVVPSGVVFSSVLFLVIVMLFIFRVYSMTLSDYHYHR